jgi:hypothetical protein
VIQQQNPNSEDEPTGYEAAPPLAPSDIPLSQPGALFLLGARIFSAVLYSRDSTPSPEIQLLPTHATVTKTFIGCDDHGGMTSIGSEPEAIVDTIVGLGLWAFHTSVKDAQDGGTKHQIGDADDGDDQFTQYLQVRFHTRSIHLIYLTN